MCRLLLMSFLTQKRVIPTLLPFSFLWAFMACVSICERESLIRHSVTDLVSKIAVNEVREVTECEGCPVAYFSKATARERAKFIITLEPLSIFIPAVSSVYSSQHDGAGTSLIRPLCNSSPRLKFLSTLRI